MSNDKEFIFSPKTKGEINAASKDQNQYFGWWVFIIFRPNKIIIFILFYLKDRKLYKIYYGSLV